MSENNSAAALRARLQHHTAIPDRAQAERAELIGAKADAGALLSDVELDEADAEIERLSDVIERAGSRIALLSPALAAAEAAEARQAERSASRAMADQDRATAAAMASTFDTGTAAAAAVTLRAAAIPPKPPSSTIFDPPAPTCTRDDAAWWEARNKREAEERAARMQAWSDGTLKPQPAEPNYGALRHHG